MSNPKRIKPLFQVDYPPIEIVQKIYPELYCNVKLANTEIILYQIAKKLLLTGEYDGVA